MAILDGSDVVFIARASPTRVFSSGIDIGYRLPAFCTSVGRVLLSRLSDDELATALDAMDLKPLTAFTVTDRQRLMNAIIADRNKATRWSIAKPSRDFARSRCRSAVMTAQSLRRSIWARMSIGFRLPK